MWRPDDASRLGRLADMDRRMCPSYEAGFDPCDPFGAVLERRGDTRAASRVHRRRCRSEGVDRSPYEDACRAAPRSPDAHTRTRTQPNKSHFTINTFKGEEYRRDHFTHECNLPVPENGDYVMAHHDYNRQFCHSPGNSKIHRISPPRPLLMTTLSNAKDDNRLPKVEELLEKVDHDVMEVAVMKQPLKSILNNPAPPPQGILKKPKNKTTVETKLTIEGRRRQRAASESDNIFNNYGNTTVTGYDRALFSTGNMKRAKDNSGTGYSYGAAIATYSTQPIKSSPNYRKSSARCICKDSEGKDEQTMHVLRTTAINNYSLDFDAIPVTRITSPNPVCPTVSPALPVNSVTVVIPLPVPLPAPPQSPAPAPAPVTKKKIRISRKKVIKKSSKMKNNTKLENGNLEDDNDEAQSRSPSPDDDFHMETDIVLPPEVEKVPKLKEKLTLPKNVVKILEDKLEQTSVTKLANNKTPVANGVVVAAKKVSKEKPPKEHFLTALHTTNPFKVPPARHETTSALPESITNSLRLSLFPRVPPYIKFLSHDDLATLKIPLGIQKHLKWKLTTITPIVVKKTLTNSGFRLVKSDCDTSECPQEETVEWIGIWGKHMKSLMFRAIKDGQKMNHFPGTFQIGRKDRLWRNLQKLVTKFGMKEFGIMPKSYVLPHDLKLLKHDWEKYAANDEKWIIKPPASARGTGIKVVSRWTQIPKKRPVVVQRYVSKPYLINGSKFDMRLYVLVTSVHPLRIYLYKDGLARFASVKYNDEPGSLNDRYMHLTNYSINRLSKNYTPNEDFAACEGHKWTLQTLFQYLKTEKHVDSDALWESMKDLVIKTIISGEASISSLTKTNITSRYNCYELFGIDVLLDEDLKPWLLEVNISPSLHSASPLDIHVKGPLVTSVLNIAQFQVPDTTNLESLTKEKPHKLGALPYDSRLYTVYLSKEERDKHIIYTNMDERDMYLRDILSTLTPDDVRHLIQAEDEYTQVGSMEKIFPTHHSHKYLGFLAGPRYYNRLFDAWETRYHRNRDSGIELLKSLCDIGYHLEVPPVPLKNDVDAPSPAASERPSVASSIELVTVSSAGFSAGPRICGDPVSTAPSTQTLEPRA